MLPLASPSPCRGLLHTTPTRGSTTLRLQGPQVASHRTRAHMPHHRLYITHDHPPLPHQHSRRVLLHLPMTDAEADAWLAATSAAVLRIAEWLSSGQWQQQLASGRHELRARLQALCVVLAHAYSQARVVWQHVLACWPAWRASLQDDAEVVLEYALGLLPAWLAAAHAGVARAAREAAASAPAQQLTTVAYTAAQAAASGAQQLSAAVQNGVEAATARLAPLALPPLPPAKPSPAGGDAKQRPSSSSSSSSKKGSKGRVEVAEVAYSLLWFGGVGSPAAGRGDATLQQQLQQLQADMAAQSDALLLYQDRPRRWKAPQRHGWVDAVAARVLHGRDSRHAGGSGAAQRPGPSCRHYRQYRQQHSEGLRLPDVPEALCSAGRAVQERACGLAASSQAATQQVRTMLVVPVQRAAAATEAPKVLAAAAGASLVAAAVAQAALYQSRAAAQQQLQQQAAQKAEALRAQKARIMGALQQSQAADAASTGSRRRAAVLLPGVDGGAPAAVAAEEFEDADVADGVDGVDSMGADASDLGVLEMDPQAAALWQSFLSGSRARNVPMWDSHMAQELPKVSKREAERQTQKIRAASAPEDSAALEAADMQQLNEQLQALTEAPMGRAARSAWLKQQHHEQQQQEQQQPGDAARGEERARGSGKRPSSAENPFAISPEARAQWAAEDPAAEGPEGPTPRQAARAPEAAEPSAGTAQRRPGSRSGSRQRSGTPSSGSSSSSSSGNPFAISGEVRAQWEQEDSVYADATPRPLSQPGPGGLLHSLLGIFGGGSSTSTPSDAQPAASQQHRRRQQQRQQQRGPRARPQAGMLAAASEPQPEQGLLRGETGMPPAPAAAPSAAPPSPTAAAAGQGDDAIQEGSPEWQVLRTEVMRSGAARRARQQQQQPGPAGPAAQLASSSSGSSASLAAAVSQKDMVGITAEPSSAPQAGQHAEGQRASMQAAAPAAAGQGQAQQEAPVNPFAVDNAVAIDDDAAFELGQQIDQEASGIKLRL